ncbi:MAG: DUF4276 family protein [Solirubrobacterales bacterium]
MSHIALVVEGHADAIAVPELVRRYLAFRGHSGILVGRPLNTKSRGKLLKDGELERFAQLAAMEPGASALLVVFDADDDRACELGPSTLGRINGLPVPTQVCIAIREYENWIMASAETVLDNAVPLDDPEGRGAAHAIKMALRPRAYVKPRDQPALSRSIDFELARRRCPSLDRFLKILDEMAEMIV